MAWLVPANASLPAYQYNELGFAPVDTRELAAAVRSWEKITAPTVPVTFEENGYDNEDVQSCGPALVGTGGPGLAAEA